MDNKSNTFLETEPVGRLMGKYAVPCVISLLVAEAIVGAAPQSSSIPAAPWGAGGPPGKVFV